MSPMNTGTLPVSFAIITIVSSMQSRTLKLHISVQLSSCCLTKKKKKKKASSQECGLMMDKGWHTAAVTLAMPPSSPDNTPPTTATACPQQSRTVSWDLQAPHLPRRQASQAAVMPCVIGPAPLSTQPDALTLQEQL